MAATATLTIDSKIVITSDSGTTFPSLANSATWAPAQKQYTSGLGNGNVDISYAARLTVPNGAPVSIDLSGSLKDLVQANAVFAEATAIGFYNRGSNNVTISGNWITSMLGTVGASIPLQASARCCIDFPNGGIPVTNSTADTITFTSAAGTNDVDVVIGGRSA